MRRFSLILLILLPFFVHAQKVVRKYYDPEKQKLQEQYQVLPDNETLTGKYQRFYENGKVMLEGNFDDGEKSGLFT